MAAFNVGSSSTKSSVSRCPPFPSPSSARLLSLLTKIQNAAHIHNVALADKAGLPLPDCKPYVDMPLKLPVEEAEAAFEALVRHTDDGSISFEALSSLLKEYFDEPGSDLARLRPEDYVLTPGNFLLRVTNERVKHWALEVHSKWLELVRTTSARLISHPERHTLLKLQYPFVIPGSRFREVYYWDSFWVIKGLIVSKMFTTAKRIVLNLLSLVDCYGFVPNGTRIYYGNRSQPPLLSEMVREIYVTIGGDGAWLETCLPRLAAEHVFWTSNPRTVRFSKNGVAHQLSRYFSSLSAPRPETYTIDLQTAAAVPESARPQLFLDIAAAAESGWDFSSRWMADGKNLQTLRTTKIVPVDLNAYLFQMEGNLAFFAKAVGRETDAAHFAAAQAARKAAIDAILWDETRSQWSDYWLPDTFDASLEVEEFRPDRSKRQNSASNFVPLWAGLTKYDNDKEMRILLAENVIGALKSSGLLQPVGIATTDACTGQQWDFPNGWAPLQHMIIEGLAESESPAGKDLAEDLARRWLRTNYTAYIKTGEMHEKYDVRKMGDFGSGGEYEPQTGFGWSNGVVLALLDRFGWDANTDITA